MVTDSSARVRALQRAEEILGRQGLRDYLNVPMRELTLWLRGDEAPPTDVFLRVVDLIVERAGPRAANGGTIQVRLASNVARCPTCDCTEFRQVDPSAPR
jgi:hypothetical protein